MQAAKRQRDECKKLRILEDVRLGHKVVELPRDCPAPFSGQLLNPKLAAELQQDVENKPAELKAAVTSTAAYWKADLDYRLKLKEIDYNTLLQKHKLQKQLLDRSLVWYRQPWFVILVTTLTLTALSASTAYVYRKIAGD